MRQPSRPSSREHEEQADQSPEASVVRCGVLTVSDTRSIETDRGGPLIVRHLEEAGHVCAARAIVRDQPTEVEHQLQAWLSDPGIQAILTTGGTGIAQRDTTIEVVRRLLTIELPGFGELFRMLSYQDIGPAAMLSRAVAGIVVTPNQRGSAPSGTAIFAMPGSPNAVETAMTKLIVPQLRHVVWERRK